MEKVPQPDIEQAALEQRQELEKLPVSPEYLETLVEEDGDLRELLQDMIDQCKSYASSVLELNAYLMQEEEMDPDERQELENSRTRSHNATIDAVRIFVRTLRQKDKDVSWAKSIDLSERTQVGRFAILLAFAAVLQNSENSV